MGRRLRRRAFLRGLVALAALLLAPVRRLLAEAARPLFAGAARERLSGFAAVIVPAWKGQPAAGAGDFVERFEALARTTPGRVDTYQRYFERFVREVDARRQPPDEAALAVLFEGWYEEWRREASPRFAARFFELLRRDMLRTYYGSAEGWRAVGFHGPAHRPAPDGPT